MDGMIMVYLISKADAMLNVLAWTNKNNQKYTTQLGLVLFYKTLDSVMRQDKLIISILKLQKTLEPHIHLSSSPMLKFQQSQDTPKILFSWHAMHSQSSLQSQNWILLRHSITSTLDTLPKLQEQKSELKSQSQLSQHASVKLSCHSSLKFMLTYSLKSANNMEPTFG